MTTSHEPHTADSQTAMVFAKLGDLTISVCAPAGWDRERVEAFANGKFPHAADPFVSVDALTLFKLKTRTPNVCNQAPSQRMHWLLFRRSLAHRDFDKPTPDFKNGFRIRR